MTTTDVTTTAGHMPKSKHLDYDKQIQSRSEIDVFLPPCAGRSIVIANEWKHADQQWCDPTNDVIFPMCDDFPPC